MIRNCIEAPTNFDIDVLLIPTNFENSDEAQQYEKFRKELIESVNSNHTDCLW